MEGLRPAIVPADLKPGLSSLRKFRHAARRNYDGFDYELAEPNVSIAEETVPQLSRALEAFCREFGILPPGHPTEFLAEPTDAASSKPAGPTTSNSNEREKP